MQTETKHQTNNSLYSMICNMALEETLSVDLSKYKYVTARSTLYNVSCTFNKKFKGRQQVLPDGRRVLVVTRIK